jgi:hypothetical protein
MTTKASAIAIHSFVVAMGLTFAAVAPAAVGEGVRDCLAAAKKRADKGDGQAAKALAVHYGDAANSDASPSLAWRYLRQAIEKGVDVSDVPSARGSIVSYCSRDAELARLVEAKPASGGKKAGGADARPVRTSPPEAAAQRAKPVVAAAAPAAASRSRSDVSQAGMSGQSEPPAAHEALPGRDSVAAEAAPKTVVAATRISGTAVELERQAADSEWSGNVRGAIPYWEKARQLGSKAAARRLYQIFSFGAGDVEADYVKAIEAHQYALQMGLDVPPLPRK